MNIYNAENVIIGGGISGMTAAIELLNFGKKIVLIDKGFSHEFGAMAKWSFGGMFFVNTPEQRLTGIKDNPELAFRDWKSIAEFEPTDYLGEKWAENYVYNCTDHVYRWVKKQGINFLPPVQWVERGLYGPGSSMPRFHIAWGTGKGITDALEKTLRSHKNFSTHAQLYFEHTVEEILVENNRIIGFKGTSPKGAFKALGEHNIVAAGGMGGNLEKVRENWPKNLGNPPKTLLNGLHPCIDGSMLDAGEKIGANVVNKDLFWNYASGIHHPRPKFEHEGVASFPPKSGIWLDATGKKFGPTPLIVHFDTKYSVDTIAKTEQQYSWHISNYKMMLKEFAISGSEFTVPFREKSFIKLFKMVLSGNVELVKDMVDNCKDVLVADTLEELVAKMNKLNGDELVNKNSVIEAVNRHDEMLNRGKKFHNDEQLRRIANARQYIGDKMRVYKNMPIQGEKNGPFVALRLFLVSRKSLGGLKTDLSCRVLDQNNQPMEGLYAIGEASGFGGGGIHGKATLEGTFLGACVFNGRVLAHHIADKKLF